MTPGQPGITLAHGLPKDSERRRTQPVGQQASLAVLDQQLKQLMEQQEKPKEKDGAAQMERSTSYTQLSAALLQPEAAMMGVQQSGTPATEQDLSTSTVCADSTSALPERPIMAATPATSGETQSEPPGTS